MALPVPREPQPLPATRSRALIALWNPEASGEQFARLVESDPALTAATLRAANSASSAPLVRVNTPREAVIRLGIETVRKLIAGVIVRSEFEGLSHSRIDTQELWRHLIATALIAEASCPRPEERGLMFTAGLLHDIGRLSLATQNPSSYSRVVMAAQRGADVARAERDVFGVTHTATGARLAQAWLLPEAVVEAAAEHHAASADGAGTLVLQARDLARRLGYGDGVIAPCEPTLDPDDPYVAIIEDLGGPEGLDARIEWFRDAFAAA